MSICQDKFKELKQRAVDLRYNQTMEQDDLMRKTELYVSECFKFSVNYQNSLSNIKFTPLYSFGSTSIEIRESAWENGRQQLVNFLDTRIEELAIKSKPAQGSVTEKLVEKVYVKDVHKIEELSAEITALKAKKRLWNRVDYTLLTTIFIAFVGGAFLFGLYFGNNRFDKEKIQLYNENILLKEQIDSFRQTK
jgi:hypothetical protein